MLRGRATEKLLHTQDGPRWKNHQIIHIASIKASKPQFFEEENAKERLDYSAGETDRKWRSSRGRGRGGGFDFHDSMIDDDDDGDDGGDDMSCQQRQKNTSDSCSKQPKTKQQQVRVLDSRGSKNRGLSKAAVCWAHLSSRQLHKSATNAKKSRSETRNRGAGGEMLPPRGKCSPARTLQQLFIFILSSLSH